MRENTLRNAPLDGLSITLTWSIPENPPSQVRRISSRIISFVSRIPSPIVRLSASSRTTAGPQAITHTATSCRTNGKASASTWTSTGSAST